MVMSRNQIQEVRKKAQQNREERDARATKKKSKKFSGTEGLSTLGEVTLTHTDFSIQPIFGIRHTIILTRNSAYNYFSYQGIVHTLKKMKL